MSVDGARFFSTFSLAIDAPVGANGMSNAAARTEHRIERIGGMPGLGHGTISLYLFFGMRKASLAASAIGLGIAFLAPQLTVLAQDKSAQSKAAEPAAQKDALQNIKFATKSKFILMPVFDKTGSSTQYGSAGGSTSTTNEFATEVLNDAVRQAGATTISWFKVNAAMNKKFGQTGLNRADLTNDSFIPDLVAVAKGMKVKYIIRPAILNISSTSSTETSVNPAGFIPVFGMFAGASKTKTQSNATVTIKIDIISVAADDIIGTARFEGAVRQQKESGPFGGYSFDTSSYSGGGMTADAKAAMFDAIDKAVDFIASKVN